MSSYFPIGHGMLTGQIKSLEDLEQGDFRRMFPRFKPENFETNIKLVKELGKISEKKKCTPAQLAAILLREHDPLIMTGLCIIEARYTLIGDCFPLVATKFRHSP